MANDFQEFTDSHSERATMRGTIVVRNEESQHRVYAEHDSTVLEERT